MVQLDGANYFMCDLEFKKVCCCLSVFLSNDLEIIFAYALVGGRSFVFIDE